MEKLPKKFKQKWVKALLSGKYRQVIGVGYKDDERRMHCVLGVGGIVLDGDPSNGYRIFDNKYIECELIYLNDQGSVPFEVIAGIINQ